MHHRFLLVSLFSILACVTVRAQDAQPEPDRPPLIAGQEVADSLEAGAVHAYALDLEGDQFIFGEAVQHTVDVVVTVYAPDDAVVETFDASARGPERFRFETETGGRYRVEVSPFEEASGSYTITVHRIEPVASTPEGRVDQWMAAYDREGVPGGVVGVVQDGEVTFEKAYGMADLAHGLPFTTATVSDLGSVSKQFTAFAVALLAGQGKLALDDDVRTYLPEVPDLGQTVTLRNLLNHTGEYREVYSNLGLEGWRDGDAVRQEDALRVVMRQPELQAAPGSVYNYNNTGYMLLADVVARVSGQAFPEWMAEHVFGPLGMTSTVIMSEPGQIIPNAAESYAPAEQGGYRRVYDNSTVQGAGGVYSTAGDLAKWMRNFRTGEVGGPGMMATLTERAVLTTGDTLDYALGLSVDVYRGLRRVAHSGSSAGYRSMLMYFPEIDAGVVTLSNNASFSGGIPLGVAEAFFEEHMQPVPEEQAGADEPPADPTEPWEPSEEALAAYAGRYYSDEVQAFYTVVLHDGALVVQHPRLDDGPLRPAEEDSFTAAYPLGHLVFERGEEGRVTGFTVSNGRTRGVRFERVN